MPRSPGILVALVPLIAAGCEAPLTEDLLHVTFGAGELAPPVEVDTQCTNGGCDGLEQLEAVVHLEEHDLLPEDAEVEFLQYRIDYELHGIDDIPPYYANATSIRVSAGGEASFVVRAAGGAQREWIVRRYGPSQIDGLGTLTLAGYDHRNETVLVEVPFDIGFGDFVAEGGTP